MSLELPEPPLDATKAQEFRVRDLEQERSEIIARIKIILELITKNGLPPTDALQNSIKKWIGLNLAQKLATLILNLNTKINPKLAKDKADNLRTLIPELETELSNLVTVEEQLKTLFTASAQSSAVGKNTESIIVPADTSKTVVNNETQTSSTISGIQPVFYPIDSAMRVIREEALLSGIDQSLQALKNCENPQILSDLFVDLVDAVVDLLSPENSPNYEVLGVLEQDTEELESVWKNRIEVCLRSKEREYLKSANQYLSVRKKIRSTDTVIKVKDVSVYEKSIKDMRWLSKQIYALKALITGFEIKLNSGLVAVTPTDELDNIKKSEVQIGIAFENIFGLKSLFTFASPAPVLESKSVSSKLANFSTFLESPDQFFDTINRSRSKLNYNLISNIDLNITTLKSILSNDVAYSEIKALLAELSIFEKNFGKFADDFEIVAQVFAGNSNDLDVEQIRDAQENLNIYGIYVGSSVSKIEFLKSELEAKLANLPEQIASYEKSLRKPTSDQAEISEKIQQLSDQITKLKKNIQIISFFLSLVKYVKDSIKLSQTRTKELIKRPVSVNEMLSLPNIDGISETERILWDAWGYELADDDFEDLDLAEDNQEVIPEIATGVEAEVDPAGEVVKFKRPKKDVRKKSSGVFPTIPRSHFAKTIKVPASSPLTSTGQQVYTYYGIPSTEYQERISVSSDIVAQTLAIIAHYDEYPSEMEADGISSLELQKLKANAPLLNLSLKSHTRQERYHNSEISVARIAAYENELMKIVYKKLNQFISPEQKENSVYKLFQQVYQNVSVSESGQPSRQCFPENGEPDYKAIAYNEFYHTVKSEYSYKPSVYNILIKKQVAGNTLDDSESQYVNLVESYVNKDKIMQTIRSLSYYFGVMDAGDFPSNIVTKAISEGLIITYQEKLDDKKLALENEIKTTGETTEKQATQMTRLEKDIALLETSNLSNPQLVRIISQYGVEPDQIRFVNQYLAHNASYVTHLTKNFEVIKTEPIPATDDHPIATTITTSQASHYIVIFPNISKPHSLPGFPVPVITTSRRNGKLVIKYDSPQNPSGIFLNVSTTKDHRRIVHININPPKITREQGVLVGDRDESGKEWINGDKNEPIDLHRQNQLDSGSQPLVRTVHEGTDREQIQVPRPRLGDLLNKHHQTEELDHIIVASVVLSRADFVAIDRNKWAEFIQDQTSHEKPDKKVRRKKPKEASDSENLIPITDFDVESIATSTEQIKNDTTIIAEAYLETLETKGKLSQLRFDEFYTNILPLLSPDSLRSNFISHKGKDELKAKAQRLKDFLGFIKTFYPNSSYVVIPELNISDRCTVESLQNEINILANQTVLIQNESYSQPVLVHNPILRIATHVLQEILRIFNERESQVQAQIKAELEKKKQEREAAQRQKEITKFQEENFKIADRAVAWFEEFCRKHIINTNTIEFYNILTDAINEIKDNLRFDDWGELAKIDQIKFTDVLREYFESDKTPFRLETSTRLPINQDDKGNIILVERLADGFNKIFPVISRSDLKQVEEYYNQGGKITGQSYDLNKAQILFRNLNRRYFYVIACSLFKAYETVNTKTPEIHESQKVEVIKSLAEVSTDLLKNIKPINTLSTLSNFNRTLIPKMTDHEISLALLGRSDKKTIRTINLYKRPDYIRTPTAIHFHRRVWIQECIIHLGKKITKLEKQYNNSFKEYIGQKWNQCIEELANEFGRDEIDYIKNKINQIPFKIDAVQIVDVTTSMDDEFFDNILKWFRFVLEKMPQKLFELDLELSEQGKILLESAKSEFFAKYPVANNVTGANSDSSEIVTPETKEIVLSPKEQARLMTDVQALNNIAQTIIGVNERTTRSELIAVISQFIHNAKNPRNPGFLKQFDEVQRDMHSMSIVQYQLVGEIMDQTYDIVQEYQSSNWVKIINEVRGSFEIRDYNRAMSVFKSFYFTHEFYNRVFTGESKYDPYTLGKTFFGQFLKEFITIVPQVLTALSIKLQSLAETEDIGENTAEIILLSEGKTYWKNVFINMLNDYLRLPFSSTDNIDIMLDMSEMASRYPFSDSEKYKRDVSQRGLKITIMDSFFGTLIASAKTLFSREKDWLSTVSEILSEIPPDQHSLVTSLFRGPVLSFNYANLRQDNLQNRAEQFWTLMPIFIPKLIEKIDDLISHDDLKIESE